MKLYCATCNVLIWAGNVYSNTGNCWKCDMDALVAKMADLERRLREVELTTLDGAIKQCDPLALPWWSVEPKDATSEE